MQVASRTFFVILALFWMLVPLQGHAEFQKSQYDHREYRAVDMDNGMQVLIISDPETIESAVSLAVRVGGADDPETRAGMAHLLEHMLFLGTEKYPELDGYRRFIEQHGGDSNAYTATDITNYNFSIDPSYLKPALDQFSEFFKAPLFPVEQVDRERGVVDAEYQMRTQRDAVRRWAAMRHAYNPRHPSAKFISGTGETLSGDVRGELVEFYKNRYSSNLMNLVVLGQESLDVLQSWVKEKFDPVVNSQAAELQSSEPLFLSDHLPMMLKVRTLKDNPSLTLLFPVRDLQPLWRESPDSYISHLLGHEGTGSLLSILKDAGWAEGLYVSPGNAGYRSYSMNVRISLTDEGFRNWETVTANVFQYIREIDKRGIDEWRFTEQKILNELTYQFTEIDNVRSYVTYIASALHKYPRNEILPALYLVEKYDPELISSLLKELNPQNVVVILASPEIETDAVTPFIRSEYSLVEIPKETQEVWNVDAADSSGWLPEPNIFLPENVGLKDDPQTDVPERIIDSPGYELWYQTDTSFDVPKASFFVSIRSPVVKNVTDSILLSLYTKAINDQLNEFAYPAQVAGLEFSLYGHSRGLSFRISGYSDKQNVLMERIVDVLNSPNFDREVFLRHKDEVKRGIENRKKENAYTQTLSEFYSLIVEPYWTDAEELEALDSIEFDALVDYSRRFLERVKIVVLSHGNVRREAAIAMGNYVTANLLNPEQVATVAKNDVIDLPENNRFVRALDIQDEDSAIVVYIQGTGRSISERVRFSLLTQIIQVPFFSELRSVQQLGYVVFASYIPIGQVPGIMFVIQSPNTAPEDMEVAISKFLDAFSDRLSNFSDEEFEKYRTGLIKQILEDDATLSDRSSRYWTAIDQKDYEFDQLERVAEALKNLRREDFQNFVADLLIDKTHGRITTLGFGKNHELTESKNGATMAITAREQFKSEQKLFPPL